MSSYYLRYYLLSFFPTLLICLTIMFETGFKEDEKKTRSSFGTSQIYSTVELWVINPINPIYLDHVVWNWGKNSLYMPDYKHY